MNVNIKKAENTELVKGAFALTLSVFIVKVIGYLYKLPLSHILGDEGMGYFNSAYSVFAFFYMLSLGGVPRAVAICVTEARVKNGLASARKILNLSLKIFLSIGVVFAVLLMTFSRFFSEIIGNSTARLSLLCIAPSLTFVSAAGVLRGYLNGIGRVNDVAIAEILDGVSKFVTGLTLALIASRKNESVSIVSAYTVLGVSIGAFIGAVFMFVCSKIKKDEENTEQNNAIGMRNGEILRKIFKISVPITISSAILGATNIIDLGMIMRRLESLGMSTTEAVALYGNFTTLVVPLLNLVSAFMMPLATASMPHITKSKTLGKGAEYYELLTQILCLTALAVLPIMLAYLFFAEDILVLLFNDLSANKAVPLLMLASPSVFFSAMLIMSNTALEASGYPQVPLVAMGAGALLKIVSGYFLIGTLGIYGAPISTTLCYFLAFLISIISVRTKLHLKASLIRITAPPILISVLLFIPSSAIYHSLIKGDGNSLKFIIFGGALALTYIGLIWIFMRKRVKLLTNYVKIAKKQDTAL